MVISSYLSRVKWAAKQVCRLAHLRSVPDPSACVLLPVPCLLTRHGCPAKTSVGRRISCITSAFVDVYMPTV